MESTRRAGPYLLGPAFAVGGTSTVHLASLRTREGFRRTSVVKRLREELEGNAAALELLLQEARIAAHVRQTNVVPVLDVVRDGDEILLVSEYVHGVTLATLMNAGEARIPIPIAVAATIARDLLDGLHAAHSASSAGVPLGIVHRDVSPENVIMGEDGIARWSTSGSPTPRAGGA